MTTLSDHPIATPTISTHPALRLGGLRERHDMTRANTIPMQWQRFQPHIGHIDGAVPVKACGVVIEGDEQLCDYFCGVEVMPGADLPPDFTTVTVPAGRFARLAHRGHVSTIRATNAAMLGEWLPRSGHRQAEGISFVEYYGPDFNGQTGLGTIEIWICLAD